MSGIRNVYGRTTPLLLSNQLYARLRETQNELLQKQKEITTGKSVQRPSDGAEKVSGILYLRQMLQTRQQEARNLEHALGVLNNADAAISDATDILREAKSIASSQVGVGSDAATRAAEAEVIAAQIKALIDIGNRQFNQLSLFGGNAGAAANGVVFEEFLGGIRYKGGDQNLRADVGGIDYEPFTSNGLDAFGALSSRVATNVDLQPQATADTRLVDVAGALGNGVRDGSIVVTVNGTPVTVDLTTADTLGDVVTRVNDAIDSVAVGAGSLAIAGEGFVLIGNGANTVSIAELGNGKTAADLGLVLSSTGGVPSAGASVEPKITLTTRLADLAAAVDWASGLTITQGEVTKTADFSSAQTVEDVINVINDLDLGLRMQINDAGTGLDLITEVSGIALSVGENGGTTAEDLGIRTYGGNTLLSDFRDGLGIENIEGEDDFSITLHDGTTFNVNIDGVTTAGELVTAIQAAAAAAGLTVGVDFDVAFASVGNGLQFTDNTVGAGAFRIDNVGLSLVADQLGIKQNAGAGSTILGEDNATVRADGLFTHLIDLRDALRNDSTLGITIAGTAIEDDLEQLARAHARIGVDAKRLGDQRTRAEDLALTEQAMLSDLQDADLTEVITRFSQLQLQLQASLQAGAQNMQLSLLDFLR